MTLKQRLVRARKRYLRSPNRVLLRRYLILKARRALEQGDSLKGWDSRMCRYYGVDPNVNEGCRRAIVRGYAEGLVPTSTKRTPVTKNGSYHTRRNARGEGQGVDQALVEHEIGTAKGRARMVRFQEREHARQHRASGRIGGCDLLELIGPDNRLVVLLDRETDLIEGTPLETQHDNHCHEAYAG